MIWKPHVTVAAVIEQDNRFLLVEENTDDGIRLNQPAGHWEQNETLVEGTAREVLEETAHHFSPQWLLGIYHWLHPRKDAVYLRFAYAGALTGFDPQRPLDEGIIRAAWFGLEEIRASVERHRSPLVLRCIEDYLAGRRYPLELVTHFTQ